MDKLEKISGEEGFYKIRKVKILYEISYFEKHFIKKKLETGERSVIVDAK